MCTVVDRSELVGCAAGLLVRCRQYAGRVAVYLQAASPVTAVGGGEGCVVDAKAGLAPLSGAGYGQDDALDSEPFGCCLVQDFDAEGFGGRGRSLVCLRCAERHRKGSRMGLHHVGFGQFQRGGAGAGPGDGASLVGAGTPGCCAVGRIRLRYECSVLAVRVGLEREDLGGDGLVQVRRAQRVGSGSECHGGQQSGDQGESRCCCKASDPGSGLGAASAGRAGSQLVHDGSPRVRPLRERPHAVKGLLGEECSMEGGAGSVYVDGWAIWLFTWSPVIAPVHRRSFARSPGR